jgi:hypothetical protein
VRVRFEMFRSLGKPWEALFDEAAEFAGRLRPEQLISISHSEDAANAVVSVWYWEGEGPRTAPSGPPVGATPSTPPAGELEAVEESSRPPVELPAVPPGPPTPPPETPEGIPKKARGRGRKEK